MPTKPNKKLAVLQRRQQVAELALQGWSQTAIAEHLEVTQGTISTDLKMLRKDWRESALRDFDEARAVELRKLALIEREAWAAWERSQKPQQSAIVEGDGTGPRNRKSLTNRYGDPRFLEQVNKCIAQRRALLGLDIPAVDTSQEDSLDGSVTVEIRRERVQALLTAIGDRGRTQTTGAGSPLGESRDVCARDESGEMETGTAPRLPGPDFDDGT